ncbi:bifunctional folylpolyglutamate synthase/dihydrofolate synthase [Adhaeretor mobilis]|uniref:Dihydrofolate synthase/folylpolyglutamate synthase n=1 Tax=Adhaeretor mobilis TaxID=1930276 RepID=A0A517MRR8_9BACT|nr:folylpolyglutamate synthase/dihydrofolate synthase family protein [Adhaeretor mobilis]QDS97576.1 Folylpolyglutamate synthase [Adhaeretor mobilis]
MTEAYTAAVEYLYGRINFESLPSPPYAERHMKLDRMRQLLTRLGQPAAGVPTVHIAGTKGKGSTSALLASIVQAANYSVGVFSSPHLQSIEERFCVNSLPCKPQELVELVELVRPAVALMDEEADAAPKEQLRPTFFEIATAIALLHFARRKVDLVILEVGLGGRLDSTNVCSPCCTVITSISYDHTKQLGETLAEIATEKAGIVKPGVPLVTGPLKEAPRRVIAEVAERHGARMIAADRDYRFRYDSAHAQSAERVGGQLHFEMQADRGHPLQEPFVLDDAKLKLLGRHQAANAAVALATSVELRRQGWLLPEAALRAGLAETTLPGRVELISERPAVVLDTAHNVASVTALVETLAENFSCERRHLLLAATREKDVAGMLRVLLPFFQTVTLTQYEENTRAVPVAKLQETVQAILAKEPDLASQIEVEVVDNPKQAWQKAREQAQPEDLLCVTGSFFIAAELRPVLRAEAVIN